MPVATHSCSQWSISLSPMGGGLKVVTRLAMMVATPGMTQDMASMLALICSTQMKSLAPDSCTWRTFTERAT